MVESVQYYHICGKVDGVMGYEYKYYTTKAAFGDIKPGVIFACNGKVYRKLGADDTLSCMVPPGTTAVEIGNGERFSNFQAIDIIGGVIVVSTSDE